MARRRTSRSKSRAKGRVTYLPNIDLSALQRAETYGVVLAFIGILTFFALITPRGAITEWWVNLLRTAFGDGVWLFPLLAGGVGLWMVLRALEDEDVKSEQYTLRQPIGGLLVFLASLALYHLLRPHPLGGLYLAEQSLGGGWVGFAVSEVVREPFGNLIAAVFLTLVLIAGLVSIAGAVLWSGVRRTAAAIAAFYARYELFGGLRRTPEPVLPVPQDEEPPWRRQLRWLRERITSRPTVGHDEDAEADAAPPGPFTQPAQARNLPAPSSRAATPAPRASAPAQNEGPAFPQLTGSGRVWQLPKLEDIFDDSPETEVSGEEIRARARIIEQTLGSFGVPVRVVEANQGPAVTQFGLQPGYITKKEAGGKVKQVKVKVSRISALANDLALALAASPIRIEAPVPGRPIVGVEVPNVITAMVTLRGVMETDEFAAAGGRLPIALGQDVSGQPYVADLTRMPHLLIAGATGSGKSVCINAIIASLLCTHTPDTLRLLMVDPKMVELTAFNSAPHLVAPVINEIEKVVPMLMWAVQEMERRYQLFAKASVRNLEGYNEQAAKKKEPPLPYIVIIVDELADLMMAAPEEVEKYLTRLAQMARAVGLHLILATQRPSVDVVTGVIKANFPARIAFAVTSQVDSRVILDTPGAERLLGRGDMLFMAPDSSKLVRLQGVFVSDDEIGRLVRYWKGMRTVERKPYTPPPEGLRGIATPPEVLVDTPDPVQEPLWDEFFEQMKEQKTKAQKDTLYDDAVQVVQEAGRASTSLLQRRLRIGYSRASRLIDLLEAEGVIGPDEGGTKGRRVLIRPGRETPQSRDGSEDGDADNTDNDRDHTRVWF